MAQHAHYWSCTSFADWIRGSAKPGAATSEGWDEWSINSAAAHPLRYQIAEKWLGKIQDFVTWPARKLSDTRNYIANRFVSKTHALTSTLQKGKYYEYDTRILHCIFQSLVDYVEIEEAHCWVAWGDSKKKYTSARRTWWREWRCPQAGIDRLNWAAALVIDQDMGVAEGEPNYGKPTSQAITAQEVLNLYVWWTVTRPARPDPWVASGWAAFNAACRESSTIEHVNVKTRRFRCKKSEAEKKESNRLFALMNKIEAKYEAEDEKMMLKLIKIRKGIWT